MARTTKRKHTKDELAFRPETIKRNPWTCRSTESTAWKEEIKAKEERGLCTLEEVETELARPTHNVPKLGFGPGVYFIFDEMSKLLYIGMSKSILKRICGGNHCIMSKVDCTKISVQFVETETAEEARKLEGKLIDKFNPPANHYPSLA